LLIKKLIFLNFTKKKKDFIDNLNEKDYASLLFLPKIILSENNDLC